MLKMRLVLAMLAAGLLMSAAIPGPTEAVVSSSDEPEAYEEALASVLCDAIVCIEALGWICAPSSEPDPGEVQWDMCNAKPGSDPFEWNCELP